MAHPQIAVFARLADGNAERIRAIEGQATLLGRTMHGVAYDAVHDEIVVPHQFGQGILIYAGDASGEVPPKRVIMGSKTELISPDRLDIDPVRGEIFIPEGDRVLVFSRESQGNVAPIRVLGGPDTRIRSAHAVAIDTVRDLLVVGSSPFGKPPRGQRPDYELTFFNRNASGNVKPLRVISGMDGYGNMAIDPHRGLVFVAVPPRIGTGTAGNFRGYVGVWSVNDEGQVPPRYTIAGPLVEPRGLVLDLKNKAVLVSDKQLNAILTFEVPAIFDGPAVRTR